VPNSLNSHNGAERAVLSPSASSGVDYCWNRWALRWRLKEHRVVSGVLSSAGRLFHVRGPLTVKLRYRWRSGCAGPVESQTPWNAAASDHARSGPAHTGQPSNEGLHHVGTST